MVKKVATSITRIGAMPSISAMVSTAPGGTEPPAWR